MKFIICYLLLTCSFFAQTHNEDTTITSTSYGIYCGVNVNKNMFVSNAFLIEGKVFLTKNIFAKINIGYYRTVVKDSYRVFSFKYIQIQDYKKYNTVYYDVMKTQYDVFPISIGSLYLYRSSPLNYYAGIDISYNLIDPFQYRTSEKIINEFDSINDIPNVYKNIVVLPNGSYSVTLGAGAIFHFTANLYLDVRYIFKYDNELINSHQILIGINI
ncbi:MAG: hypothetical protein FD143_3057 [Ignavibacteria bacterium]|nr:MAG: hypothetical protein FD143_3057 [Ignavibacteria bacterium]KAF0154787.1 MAG: hypothetical protein FD188_3224 [Ignavibacteria bacterium]